MLPRSRVRGRRGGRDPTVPSDPEAAVIGLLRRAALEDDHRGDGVLGAEVGDVVALDPDRQLLHRERRAEVGEGVDPPLTAVLAAETVLVEGEAGVALGELAQPPLVAALGDPHLDRRPPLLGEGVGEQLGPIGEIGTDDDRPRHRGRSRVVLAEELLGDLGRLAFGLVV